jgi:hypothetical protein
VLISSSPPTDQLIPSWYEQSRWSGWSSGLLAPIAYIGEECTQFGKIRGHPAVEYYEHLINEHVDEERSGRGPVNRAAARAYSATLSMGSDLTGDAGAPADPSLLDDVTRPRVYAWLCKLRQLQKRRPEHWSHVRAGSRRGQRHDASTTGFTLMRAGLEYGEAFTKLIVRNKPHRMLDAENAAAEGDSTLSGESETNSFPSRFLGYVQAQPVEVEHPSPERAVFYRALFGWHPKARLKHYFPAVCGDGLPLAPREGSKSGAGPAQPSGSRIRHKR